jgi:hypothetical protein
LGQLLLLDCHPVISHARTIPSLSTHDTQFFLLHHYMT